MINIITSICVDQEDGDENIIYPSTLGANKNRRRLIYWKCAAVLLATSKRCNPAARHILYTNDKSEVMVGAFDLRAYLKEIGIEIIHLPFKYFVPPAGYSHSFKNAFYKLDVVKAMGNLENDYNILLDSDCVWTKPSEEFINQVASENILLYNVYIGSKAGEVYHEVRLALGKIYKEIDPSYPDPEPIQYGGELITGKGANLKVVSDKMKEVFDTVVKKYKEGPPVFFGESSLFDGDEFLSAFVLNNMPVKKMEANKYLRRIWNTFRISTVKPEDMDLVIWHMPFEKTQGFPLLFKEVINKQSEFWTVPIHLFNIYLGQYLGVPKSMVMKRMPMLASKLVEMSFGKIKKTLKIG
jgi:hypothetical protein